MSKDKKVGIWVYAFWPMIFLAVCWGVWLYGIQVENSVKIGVRPRDIEGLIGIITHPFFHSTHLSDGSIDFGHIVNNSIPLLLLGSALFYYYKDLSYKIFFWLFIGTGVWLWSFGRSANHIGASGIVYALFGFILLTSFYGKSYFFGKEIGLKSNFEVQKMSKTLCFLGLIFSFLPGVSLLGHLSGFIAGCFLFLI